jgi:hypothetical protein
MDSPTPCSDRPKRPQIGQQAMRHTALAHIIFRVHLKPGHAVLAAKNLVGVLMLEPDTGQGHR